MRTGTPLRGAMLCHSGGYYAINVRYTTAAFADTGAFVGSRGARGCVSTGQATTCTADTGVCQQGLVALCRGTPRIRSLRHGVCVRANA